MWEKTRVGDERLWQTGYAENEGRLMEAPDSMGEDGSGDGRLCRCAQSGVLVSGPIARSAALVRALWRRR